MFITFEGIEGCGKSTQIRPLEKSLTERGIPVVTTFEPGGTKIGGTIRRILLDPDNQMLKPLTELVLYIADRAQHIEEIIKPTLEQGKWVICDRFFDATVAYQGFARGQDMPMIQYLNEKVTRGIRPDITFLFDCPVTVGLERALRRDERNPVKNQDRFEREEVAFHRKVRDGYLELARRDVDRFIIIDATRPVKEVTMELLGHLSPYLDV